VTLLLQYSLEVAIASMISVALMNERMGIKTT